MPTGKDPPRPKFTTISALFHVLAPRYIRHMRYLLAPICSLALCVPLPAFAHPHIFVATSLTILTDDRGHATGVEVQWSYDDLYSLLVLEDMELDGDYDGILTPEEQARLTGFDMHWVEGYEGDLYASGPDGPVRLSAPEPLDTRFADGKIITRHIRRFDQPQSQLVLKAYDPTFYTAYDLTGGVKTPDACRTALTVADENAAFALVETKLKEGNYSEDDYPEVGEAFADTVTVTCQDA